MVLGVISATLYHNALQKPQVNAEIPSINLVLFEIRTMVLDFHKTRKNFDQANYEILLNAFRQKATKLNVDVTKELQHFTAFPTAYNQLLQQYNEQIRLCPEQDTLIQTRLKEATEIIIILKKATGNRHGGHLFDLLGLPGIQNARKEIFLSHLRCLLHFEQLEKHLIKIQTILWKIYVSQDINYLHSIKDNEFLQEFLNTRYHSNHLYFLTGRNQDVRDLITNIDRLLSLVMGNRSQIIPQEQRIVAAGDGLYPMCINYLESREQNIKRLQEIETQMTQEMATVEAALKQAIEKINKTSRSNPTVDYFLWLMAVVSVAVIVAMHGAWLFHLITNRRKKT
jgi:hypothetical protein